MTLTSILPSLRRSIPDPIAIDRWPEWTQPTTTDVIVSGVSLLRLVDLCDTPCVHIAAAVVPGTHGRPSDSEQSSVLVATVVEIREHGIAILDADLSRIDAHLAEARLIGRASTWHSLPFALASEPGPDGAATPAADHVPAVTSPSGASAVIAGAVLPADLRAGDLVAIPCRGAVCRRQLRAGRSS